MSNSRHRSREPSRIRQKYKQGVQKSLKMRRLFIKYVVGVVPNFKFSRRRIFREEYICFKYYFACNQRRKEVFKGDNCYIKNIKRRTRKHKEGNVIVYFEILQGLH